MARQYRYMEMLIFTVHVITEALVWATLDPLDQSYVAANFPESRPEHLRCLHPGDSQQGRAELACPSSRIP